MKVVINVTRTRVADLLCSAFEGGIGYWACIEKYNEPPEPIDLSEYDSVLSEEVYPYIHYPLHGGAVIVSDVEDNEKLYTLDSAAIERGLVVFFEKFGRHAGDWLSENDDAITGDVFVQCCLFGDVIYG